MLWVPVSAVPLGRKNTAKSSYAIAARRMNSGAAFITTAIHRTGALLPQSLRST